MSNASERKSGYRMPVLFIGHGSPMNAIADNAYTKMLDGLGARLPEPKSILTLSAHWETRVTGAVEFANRVHKLAPHVDLTTNWGLDHGAWAPLIHIFPKSNIPVTQLSLSRAFSYRQHFELARKLKPLRDDGVLICGSGNLVHNLRQIRWQPEAPNHPWAEEFDDILRDKFLARDIEFFLNPESVNARLAHLAIPTLEHYLPILYVLGASEPDEKIEFIFEGVQNGSISMRSLRIG